METNQYSSPNDIVREKLQQIKIIWESEELRQEKEDVFDFMNKNFGYLLEQASKEFELK